MQYERIPTGVSGLDEILGGGLPQNHTYLLMGTPGTGKTTLGLQFLQEGVRRQEKVLYITLLQTESELQEVAASHGWDLAGIEIRVLMAEAERESELAAQTLLPNSEIQLEEVMTAIENAIEEAEPVRMVFDSIEQVRLLANDPVIYRQKILAIQRMLSERSVTTIFLETSGEGTEFKTLTHGVIVLNMVVPPFGEMRRHILIEKMRGVAFRGGYHACCIRRGGLEVFPPLPIVRKRLRPRWSEVSSGIESLDRMLGGGLPAGTACLVAGESGTGKSSLAAAYAWAAAQREEHAAVFLFDERQNTFLKRAEGLGMDLVPFLDQGLITIRQVNIGELSAGELAQNLRDAVEQRDARVVVLDSLAGYYNVMPDEPLLMIQLHEMLTYLGQQGVLSLLLLPEHSLFSTRREAVGASFLADAVIRLRRFEVQGGTRLAAAVIKKRTGGHETHIRELMISSKGIKIGEPLAGFQDVMTGSPIYIGEMQELMDE